MIASLTRLVVTLAIVFLLVAGAGLRLDTLFAGDSGESGGEQEPEKKAEDRELFLSLLRYRVIQPQPDGSLEMFPADYFLVQEAEGKARKLTASQRKERENQRRLHGILYFAPVGKLVRAQVGLWNDTRYMAAIRDNRTRPPGDFSNTWEVLSAKGHPLPSGDLVPENFGFVLNGELTAGYSDWAAVSRRNEAVTFRTTIQPTLASTLSVQIAGKPISWTPRNAKVTQLDGKEQFGCGEAKGGLVQFALKPTTRPITISITVEPSVNCERKINGLAIRQAKDAVGKYTAFDWRPIKRSGGTANSFVITTRDGIALTDPDGKGTPTQAAYDLGLVPLIGFGPAATFSIAGMMAASRLPPQGVSVALTIDSRVQAAAQKAILKQVKRMDPSGRYAKQRKGAVVVLDADTGAIVAVAGYPTVPAGARPWDYAAFGAAFPLRDPSTVMAWGIIDENNSPGSTFKPVVALSVMRSATATELPLFRRIMEGLSAGEMGGVYGIQAGQSEYFPGGPGTRGISNFGDQGLGPFGRAERSPACVKQPPVRNTFGLRQAVQFSVNVWFARLSVLLDEGNIARIVDDLVASKRKGLFRLNKPTRLIEAVRWLGIDDRNRMDLASNLPPGVKLQRYNTGVSADVLFPQVSRQAFTEVKIYAIPGAVKTLRHIAGLNGIGQSVSVHPLHMARAVMAVASGKRILPYIFEAWGGQKLTPPPPRKLGVDPALLEVLREGMKAVPEVGTAARKFPGDLACRTYGKTGTAEIVEKSGRHSAWFVGWREPKAPVGQRDKNNAKDRRLAFACMMTHGFGGFRTGGSSCAPVVSDILQALEAEDKEPKKKKKTTRRRKKSN